MRRICFGVLALAVTAPAVAQPAFKELTAYVVAVDATTLTVSNVPVAGPQGGETFVMPAPKEGAPPPTWVAEGTAKPAENEGRQPRMVMMVPKGDDKAPVTLTEFQIAKDSLKRADYPAGTSVVVKYREVDGKKVVESIEKSKAKG